MGNEWEFEISDGTEDFWVTQTAEHFVFNTSSATWVTQQQARDLIAWLEERIP